MLLGEFPSRACAGPGLPGSTSTGQGASPGASGGEGWGVGAGGSACVLSLLGLGRTWAVLMKH